MNKFRTKKDAKEYEKQILGKNKKLWSQCDRIFMRLLLAKGESLPCTVFARDMWIMAYPKRISELRAKGWNIVNERDGNKSAYRLVLV